MYQLIIHCTVIYFQVTPYFDIFHDTIDGGFFDFLRSEQTSTMTCTVCKTKWQSEKQTHVLLPLEYDENKSLSQQVTDYFKNGIFVNRCCHKCHGHEFGVKCTKKVGKHIPEKHLVKVHVKNKLVEAPKFLIVELRKFNQLQTTDSKGKVTGHTIHKIKAPRSFSIGTEAKIEGEFYDPFAALSHIGDDAKEGHFVYDIKTNCKDNEGQTQWVQISDASEPRRKEEPNDGFLFVFKLKDSQGSIKDDAIPFETSSMETSPVIDASEEASFEEVEVNEHGRPQRTRTLPTRMQNSFLVEDVCKQPEPKLKPKKKEKEKTKLNPKTIIMGIRKKLFVNLGTRVDSENFKDDFNSSKKKDDVYSLQLQEIKQKFVTIKADIDSFHGYGLKSKRYKTLSAHCMTITKDIQDLQEKLKDSKLWKLDGKVLQNKARLWMSDEEWNFDANDDLIYIQNISKSLVLATANDEKVILEAFAKGKKGQVWRKGETDNDGYFSLESLKVAKVMTATSTTLEIKEPNDDFKQECKSQIMTAEEAGTILDTKAATVDMLEHLKEFPAVEKAITDVDEKNYKSLELLRKLKNNVSAQTLLNKDFHTSYLKHVQAKELKSEIENHKEKLILADKSIKDKIEICLKVSLDHLKHWQLNKFNKLKSEIKIFDNAEDSAECDALHSLLVTQRKLFFNIEELMPKKDMPIDLKMHSDEIVFFGGQLMAKAKMYDKRKNMEKKISEFPELEGRIQNLDGNDTHLENLKKFNGLNHLIKIQVETFSDNESVKPESFKRNALTHAKNILVSQNLLMDTGKEIAAEAVTSVKAWQDKQFKAIQTKITCFDVDKDAKYFDQLQEKLTLRFKLILEIEETGFPIMDDRLLKLKDEITQQKVILSTKGPTTGNTSKSEFTFNIIE